MKSAVIVFPASNCDRDAITTLERLSGTKPHVVWHADSELPKGLDFIVIPGGFSYGDYLRSGAMAAHSPIMREVKAAAERGVKVLGICNGFQILTEAGMLPGVLLRNKHLKFVCKPVHLKVEANDAVFTKAYKTGEVIEIPVAHHDGNYFAGDDTLKALEDGGQIAFRYCDSGGTVNEEANPNGSAQNIAGIFNTKKNVLGMMPHPERYAEALVGGADGTRLFEAVLA